jgi:hypothetical protein
MARRLVRTISLLVVTGMAASIIAACGGEFVFKPGGAGRGQGVVYSEPPQELYPTPTAAPGG